MASGQRHSNGAGTDGPASNRGGRDSIALARDGDLEALGVALESCRPSLLTTANRLLEEGLRPKAGGSDLVQDAFQQAQRIFDRFEGETSEDLLAWLRGILKNKVGDLRRRYVTTAKREVHRERSMDDGLADSSGEPFLQANGRSPSSWAACREDVCRLQTAFAELPEHYQTVLRLRNAELMSFAEIATQMDVTPEAARKLWTRAIVRLQKVLRQDRDPR